MAVLQAASLGDRHRLLDGRWSVTERFERGEHEYFVVRANDRRSARVRALSTREREAWEQAASGASNKVIADSLGIGLASVANLLKRARRKLGGDAAMMFFQRLRCFDVFAAAGRADGANAMASSAPGGELCFELPAGHRWFEHYPLTQAEREVARLAAQGLSNRAIAGHRNASIHTVTKQLSRAYRKLGMAGRRALSAGIHRPLVPV